MSVVDDVRKEREDLARVLEKHRGIRKIVEDLYPDSAHFIYELLQNAEDRGATEIQFLLSSDRLIFEHNGEPFRPEDIYAITDIGEGTKSNDDDKIGRFGVGFKAVFAYSETPHIWSPTFSFKICRLVLPFDLDDESGLQGKTRFEFPFDNPKKTSADAYQEIEAGLSELAETSLLFLPNIESIKWELKGETSGEILRISHTESHIEIMKQVDGRTTTSAHFLKFSQPVAGLEKQRVAIAFALDFLPNLQELSAEKLLSDQLKIVPVPGQVAVFFPAGKETSGLRFHLHAPFVPELSRASIKETPANEPLFDQLAQLCGQALFEIRELGLLTAEFLGVLPNLQDTIPMRYAGIRNSIITQFKEHPLTPTQDRSHAPSNILFQTKAAIKDVISDVDLEILIEYDESPPKWAASAPQKNSNADRMFSSLGITHWDIHDLIEKLSEIETQWAWKEPNVAVKEWLSVKSIEWLQSLYSMFHRELSHEGDFYNLKDCPIIKLQDGFFAKGKHSYFPSDLTDGDGFPRVEDKIYKVGKSKTRQLAARKFLQEVGVREVNETELVKGILNNRYSKGSIKPQPADLKRFIKLVGEIPATASQFRDYFIFEIESGEWAKPGAVYLDAPLLDTGLSYYYPTNRQAAPYRLAARYPEKSISSDALVSFAVAIGVKTQLEVSGCNCYQNPDWQNLSAVAGQRFTDSGINRDYSFEHFADATATPSFEVSKLIWRTLNNKSFSSKYLSARYQKNRSSGYREAPSQLVHQLRSTAWVPQNDDRFVKPADAQVELLPSGLPYDAGKEWLKAIGFGSATELKNSLASIKRSQAKSLGFQDQAELEDAQWFVSLDSESRKAYRDEIKRKMSFELPTHESRNPERRAGKVGEQAKEDIDKQSEKKLRSVQIGSGEVQNEAEQYLRSQYTNDDGAMICQVCKLPLPFKLDDGRYYFEAVELHKVLAKRHHQNRLALCPNHAAMFKHAHGSADIIGELLIDCIDGNLEVILAGNDEKIYFTKTHLADLKAIISS